MHVSLCEKHNALAAIQFLQRHWDLTSYRQIWLAMFCSWWMASEGRRYQRYSVIGPVNTLGLRMPIWKDAVLLVQVCWSLHTQLVHRNMYIQIFCGSVIFDIRIQMNYSTKICVWQALESYLPNWTINVFSALNHYNSYTSLMKQNLTND